MSFRVPSWSVGAASCVAATLARIGLTPLLNRETPYALHLLAVAVATWFAGVSAGAVAAVAGAVLIHVFILRQGAVLSIGAAELPGMLMFGAVSAVLVWQVRRWRNTEVRARTTQAELRAMMDAATESIWLFSLDGRILAANAIAARRLGSSADELVGKYWKSLLRPDIAQRRAEKLDDVCRTRQPVQFEDERDGMRFSHTFYPVFQRDGSVSAIAAYSRDITDQRRTIDELRELTQRLTYHVENSPLAVIEWGPDMRLTRWAGAAERVFGWKAEEVLGKRIEDFRWVVEEDQGAVRDVSSDLETGQNSRRFSANRNYRKDGSIVHCEWYNSSLVDENGRLRSILSLVLDVTDRKRLEAELRDHTAQLARANRMKDEFLATLSHELRTPINAIVGWARMLSTSGTTPELQQRGIEVIMRNAWVQTHLIEDILDVSRIVTGTFNVQFQPMDAAAAIASALDSFRPIATPKRIALDLEPLQPMPMHGDPARIQQVLANLLSNAIKFTPDGGRVDVCARSDGGHVHVTVRDTGIGITPEFLPHVFERFAQADASATREHGGLGLGLSIVRHIVQLHGGTVGASSDGPGRGATFVVTLPTDAPAA